MELKVLGLAFLVLLTACDRSRPVADTGRLSNSIYTNDYLGWTMPLPEGFEFVSEESKAKWSSVTDKALGTSYETDAEQIDLISFRVNEGVFLSHLNSRQRFPNLKSEINYLTTGESQTRQALENAGISPSFSYDKETIDGKEFTVQDITHSIDNRILQEQKVLLNFDDHYTFLIVVTWKNPDEKEVLLKSLRDSKFEK